MASKASDLYQNMVRVDEPEARIQVELPDGLLPLALNVELPGGYVSEVVPSDVRVPHTASTMFSTADSFQMAAEFHVLMGNRPLARDGIELCRIRVRNIKWSGAGVPQIELRFELDATGVLTVSAANLDRSNAEIVAFTAGDVVTQSDIQQALADAREHEAADRATRDLIQKMLECYAFIGATNDYYSAAKKKMSHGAKSTYKQTRKRLEKALSVDVADATDDTVAELHAAEAAFRAQRQQILPLYKQVMDWYK
ncbi:Hsp70 family protein [Eggerthella guodeyinii]|uniref:Hsp70 family protein n=1 Tax=Eggerthella guodeyinii TaxID=2690837 RepID=A0A6N7RL50_9ACTN|nr:Hsp70 family protein [Eggerthella guodeyinii]MRX81498.1 Hsp70 family protein [Eggerthella guodeyinii]